MNNTDKENELKMTGTCGHRISEGVASWVKQDGKLVYGTFCGDCVYFFHKQGRLVNKELSDLISNSENLSNDSLKAELEQARELVEEAYPEMMLLKYKAIQEKAEPYKYIEWQDKAKEFLKIREGK